MQKHFSYARRLCLSFHSVQAVVIKNILLWFSSQKRASSVYNVMYCAMWKWRKREHKQMQLFIRLLEFPGLDEGPFRYTHKNRIRNVRRKSSPPPPGWVFVCHPSTVDIEIRTHAEHARAKRTTNVQQHTYTILYSSIHILLFIYFLLMRNGHFASEWRGRCSSPMPSCMRICRTAVSGARRGGRWMMENITQTKHTLALRMHTRSHKHLKRPQTRTYVLRLSVQSISRAISGVAWSLTHLGTGPSYFQCWRIEFIQEISGWRYDASCMSCVWIVSICTNMYTFIILLQQ